MKKLIYFELRKIFSKRLSMVTLIGIACGIEIPGQLILFHAHIPGHGTSPKWFSIT